MKVMRFHEFGGPEVLLYEEVEVPAPGDGEVRIEVAATSFNGVDANIRAGFMQGPIPVTLPHTPGLDVAGVVDAVGPGAQGASVGDAVVGFLPMTGDGASAEFVIAPADVLATAPSSIPLADAAALPLVGLTAWQALFEHGRLTGGQRVLIVGAGGAVGGYAVQLARSVGAHVIATASPRSAERLARLGADELVDHTAVEVTDAVADQVDVLLNLAPIEPQQFTALVGLVTPGGMVVSTTAWMPTPSDEERDVKASTVFVRSDADLLAQLVQRVDRGELHVDVTERVALADLPAVHARAAEGDISGKIIVVPRQA